RPPGGDLELDSVGCHEAVLVQPCCIDQATWPLQRWGAAGKRDNRDQQCNKALHGTGCSSRAARVSCRKMSSRSLSVVVTSTTGRPETWMAARICPTGEALGL